MFALANRFGGFLYFGVSNSSRPPEVPVFMGPGLSSSSGLIRALHSMLVELGFPQNALTFRESYLGGVEILIIEVSKLKRPLPVLVNGTPCVIQMTEDGIEYVDVSECPEASIERLAVSHDAAVRARSALRKSVNDSIRFALVSRLRQKPNRPVAKTETKRQKPPTPVQVLPPKAKPKIPLAPPTPVVAAPTGLTVEFLTWEILPEGELERQWMSAFSEQRPYADSWEVSIAVGIEPVIAMSIEPPMEMELVRA